MARFHIVPGIVFEDRPRLFRFYQQVRKCLIRGYESFRLYSILLRLHFSLYFFQDTFFVRFAEVYYKCYIRQTYIHCVQNMRKNGSGLIVLEKDYLCYFDLKNERCVFARSSRIQNRKK